VWEAQARFSHPHSKHIIEVNEVKYLGTSLDHKRIMDTRCTQIIKMGTAKSRNIKESSGEESNSITSSK
jgi:hypothetical protein